MKKLLLGGVALLAISAASSAGAADLAPYRAPVPICNWCGYYMGFTVGYTWAKFDPKGSTIPDGYLLAADVAVVNAAGIQSLKSGSITGGIEAGYNWQTGNLVYGIEVDMQAFRLAGVAINSAPYALPPPGSFTFTTSINSNWLFTARPRIGFASDNWLLYVTGGLALTDLSATFLWGDTFGASEAGVFNKIKAGYVVGGGVEAGIGAHWTLKAEYLYVNFGNETAVGNVFGIPGQVFTHTADLKASIARVGANYRY